MRRYGRTGNEYTIVALYCNVDDFKKSFILSGEKSIFKTETFIVVYATALQFHFPQEVQYV